MDDTLKARLETLQLFQGLAGKLQVKVEEKEFSDAEIRILREFYAKDPLAYAVAGEKDSYLTKIEFIEERYSSFWRKAFSPKKDETFDQEVLRVIGSINGVGEYRDCFGWPLKPDNFTTVGRRRTVRNWDLLALVPGGLFGLIGGSFLYHIPRYCETTSYELAIACYEDRTGIIGTASLAALMPFFFSGLVKLLHCGGGISYDLNRLKDAAQKTDEFLRKHYV